MKCRFEEFVEIDRLKQGLAHPLDRFGLPPSATHHPEQI
jgi:hypothetical protein